MINNILKLYKQSMDQRGAWGVRWDDCQKYALPRADADNAQLFDATAADCVDTLAANMFSLLTPPESLWISLARANVAADGANDGSSATDAATAVLRANLNNSNFYTTIHQCYLDLCVIGTACLFMAENPIGAASAFSFSAIPMNDISILRDSTGAVTAIFHTTSMSIGAAVEKYPEWTPPRNLRDALKRDPEMQIRMVQSVIGNDFVAWLDTGGDIENNIVSRGKFETCPYIIFRWAAASGEAYGRSPVLRALPDIKTANKVVELVLKNATIAVSGIWQADDDGVINLSNINLTPGAIIPKAVGSTGLTPLKSGADFDVSQLILNDLRARIRHALLADRLSVLADKQMTATEIIARNADMMRILGATYGRLLHEFIRPLVARGLSILARRGLIDPIDLNSDAELQFVAPISQLATDERATQIMSWITTATAAGLGDKINRDAVVEYLANALHIPAGLVSINN